MSQKTDLELNTQADIIADETNDGANTASRIATMYKDIIDSKPNNTVSTGTIQALSDHTSNQANPHSVTKTQVGLGNVDNTSDTDKPVSTAQQTAIDTVTKVLVTGAGTLDSAAFGKIHVCSGTSADYTLVLPTAVGNEGKMIAFKGDPDVAILNKVITIDGSGTEKIDNVADIKFACGGSLCLVARVTSGTGSWDVVHFNQGAGIPISNSNLTGYSAYTVYDVVWIKSGKRVSIIGTITGTGNTTLLPVLTIPFTARMNVTGLPMIVNNGASATGLYQITTGGSTITFYATVAGGNFTSNTSRQIFFQFDFEIA